MLSSYEAVLDQAELDRPPSIEDLPVQAPRLDALGWGATILGGFSLAAVGAGLALVLSATSRDEFIRSAVLILVGTLLLKLIPAVVRLFDVRVVTAIAAAILAVVAVMPPVVADSTGGRVAFAAVTAAFGFLSLRLWRQVRAANAEVDAWNAAYAFLTSAPRRATETELHVQLVPAGRGNTLSGSVGFVGSDGDTYESPLTTMKVMRVVITGKQRVVEPLAYAVWHDAAHSIVLTRVLVAEDPAS